VIGPAQELRDLCLEGGLEEERDPEPGCLLQDLAQLPAGAEQLIDLGADALRSSLEPQRGCVALLLLTDHEAPTLASHLGQNSARL
jgi:hypothetical protein